MRFLVRIAERVLGLMRKLKAKTVATAISKVELGEFLSGYGSVEDFLHEFRSRERPLFFFSSTDIGFFKKSGFAEKETIIKDANSICSHEFDLLGSGKTNVNGDGGKIDWHRDFKSGVRWEPDVFFIDTPFIKGSNSDIKVPWELSRFQHLPTLGKAYWLSGNEKYAREFTSEVDDWIDNNPPLYGMNWTCTMDVAIRAVNWIWGFYFFKDSPEISDDFLLKFLQSLLIHGKYIRRNLERSSGLVETAASFLVHRVSLLDSVRRGWRGVTTNHYLSDIVGLIYLGIIFPEFKEAREWREFGVKELVREMGKQVYADGAGYEGSTSYHRLETELFLSSTLLCLNNGFSFPDWYRQRLEKMLEFVMYYTKPDGSAPQIGDNDDGRLHILADYSNWDRLGHRYLLSAGALLFNRSDFKQAAGGFREETFWLLGAEGLRKFNEVPEQKAPMLSKDFPHGGYYIMRNESLNLITDCIPEDPLAPSGHKHNSRLSFELSAYGKNFIIDPGAYIYTADKDMRNLFRSTECHNTVIVDSEEQNRFEENKLFVMGHDAAVTVNRWETAKEYDFLDAEHSGYKRLKKPVTHRRLIFFDKRMNYWAVRDILTGRGSHRFDLYFHFAPLEIELDGDFPLVVKTKGAGANLAIIPLDTEDISVEIEKGWVSFRYGAKVAAPVARYRKEVLVLTEFRYVMYPFTESVKIDDVMPSMDLTRAMAFLEAER